MDFGSSHDGERQKLLDRDIREMISSLTRRLSDIQHVHKQPGTTDVVGAHVIMLAGTNTGAAMRGQLDHHHHHRGKSSGENDLRHDGIDGDEEGLGTYVNSNFQSVNNSIMMGGSYSTNDPGVHMDVSDYSLGHEGQKRGSRHGNRVARGKGKGKEKEKEKGGEHSISDQYSSSPSSSD